MQWQDTGLVVRVTPFGERDGIVHILTRSGGLCAGIAKGIRTSGRRSKSLQGIQVGTEVEAVWIARLEEQLGTWQLEPVRSFSALAFDDPLALKALQAVCDLLADSLPERLEMTQVYNQTYGLIEFMVLLDKTAPLDWLPNFSIWERDMLAALGFGLDLTECASTGSLEDLVYISPRTGRAVSRTEGLPYHDKLLPLPEWLHPAYVVPPPVKGSNISQKSDRETLEAALVCLKVTGFFLNRWVLEPIRKPLPISRGHFLDALGRSPYLQLARKAVQEKS